MNFGGFIEFGNVAWSAVADPGIGWWYGDDLSSALPRLPPFVPLTSLSFPTAPLNSDRFLQNAVSSPADLGEAWSTNVFCAFQ